MNRRQLFPALAAALTLAPMAALAKLEPEISEPAVRDLGLKVDPVPFNGFMRLSRRPIHVEDLATGARVYSHSEEEWATPRGRVRITRWPSMDFSDTVRAVEEAAGYIYP